MEPDSIGKPLTVNLEPVGDTATVVALAGELDLSTIPLAEGRLLEKAGCGCDLIIDLTNVSFIDSSGMALLIQAYRSIGDAGRLHTVIAEGSQVDRVFRLARIDCALRLFTDRESAVEALNEAVVR